MITVKVSTTVPEWPLQRQTPGSKGIWENCQFIVNKDISECDYWVVYEGLLKSEKTKCLRKNTILVTGEPPSIKKYSRRFLSQFGSIITCHRTIQGENVIYTQQGLPWMVGGRFIPVEKKWEKTFSKDFDELNQMTDYKKDKLISVVFSAHKKTKGHIARKDFISELKKELGEDLDIFGVGQNPIIDKWDVIYPYKYHLALENSSWPDYWTEKLSDAFLGGTYPIYYGCPNIYDYFSQKSLSVIDIINKPQESIETIKKVIQDNTYDQSTTFIREAKELILYKYNFFALITKVINDNKSHYGNKENIQLIPEDRPINILPLIKNYVKKIVTKI